MNKYDANFLIVFKQVFSTRDTPKKTVNTAQKMKFSIKDFSNKCDQIRRKLQIWSHLLKKSLMENFIFCAVKKPLSQYPGRVCQLSGKNVKF